LTFQISALSSFFFPQFSFYLTPGLLDRSPALHIYKRLKTSLHKPRGNLLENLFCKICAFKNNLQLLEKKCFSQTNTTPKNGILLSKLAHFQESSIFQELIIKNKSLLNKVFIYYLNIILSFVHELIKPIVYNFGFVDV
jgi:hypothetical protein